MIDVPLARLPPGRREPGLWVAPAYREHGHPSALEDVWVRDEVVHRLARVAADLLADGYGLLVWDGWRSSELQSVLHEDYRREIARASGLAGEALDERVSEFVTSPERLEPPPAHSTGAAVDVTLCEPETGAAVEMGGRFDELTDRSHPDYYEREPVSEPARTYRDRRRLLNRGMSAAEFVRLETEWWHFEFGTAYWAHARGVGVLFGRTPGPGGRS